MIKLFACDLDGTLLNKDHLTDEVILRAVDTVIENGKNFAVATGRPMHSTQREELGFSSRNVYTICMNGAMILDAHGECIYKKAISKQFLRDLFERFPSVPFECTGPEAIYFNETEESHQERFMKESIWRKAVSRPRLKSFFSDCVFGCTNEEIQEKEIMKINARIIDPEMNAKVKQFIDEKKEYVVNAPFDYNIFELTDVTVNKGAAVAKLAELLGIEEKEVAVYGDGGNDLEMLRRFEHSYATRNGMMDAKEAARKTIGYCSQHAVPKHIIATVKRGMKK